MKKVIRKTVADCPDCEEEITLKGESKVGRRVTCPHCHADLEVVEIDPVQLAWYVKESRKKTRVGGRRDAV